MRRGARRDGRGRRQRGVVLLLLLATGVLALAALGLPWLATRVQPPTTDAAQDALALRTARDALLAYAATYPERQGMSSRTAGPGLLPCPDTRLDRNDVAGQADPPCALSSGTETGLLPWRTLDLPELRDGSGAPLWYAIANGYRNNPAGIVNSDTVAALRLDTCQPTGRALAALLIAPGPALAGQQRAPQSANARYAPALYLEGANASRGDGCFSALAGAGANDTVLAIDRPALNNAIEVRVLAELRRALRRYRTDPDGNDVAGRDPRCLAAGRAPDCDDAWPWLSAWSAPAAASFAGQIGVRDGQLPLRRVGVSFPARYTAQWRLAGGVLVTGGTAPPAEACLRDSETACVLTAPAVAVTTPLPRPALAADGRCLWPGGAALRCERTLEALDAGRADQRLQRQEVVEFRGLPRVIAPPDATRPRRESVVLTNAALPVGARLSLTLIDTRIGADGARIPLGTAQLTLEGGAAVGRFEVAEVPLDLEVDDDGVLEPATRPSPGELPAWFTANGWQAYVRLAHAPADCTPAVDCLRLESRDSQTGLRADSASTALVVLAGAALAGQQRAGGGREAWFEGQNALTAGVFEARPAAADFNDRVLRLDGDE